MLLQKIQKQSDKVVLRLFSTSTSNPLWGINTYVVTYQFNYCPENGQIFPRQKNPRTGYKTKVFWNSWTNVNFLRNTGRPFLITCTRFQSEFLVIISLFILLHWGTNGNGSTIRTLLFDYKKAFDLIDYSILVRKFQLALLIGS